MWAARCASCHGAEGRGDGPAAAGLNPRPKDLSRPRLPEERHPPSRMDIIRDGKPGSAMVGFVTQLSSAELAAVTRYVKTLAHGRGAPACAMDGAPAAAPGAP